MLAFAPQRVVEASETTLQLAKVYGALGLIGFLAQIVVGVENRLLPMSAWLWSFAYECGQD